MKKILAYIVVFAVIVILIFFTINKKPETVDITQNPPASEPIQMCYQYFQETSNGFQDQAWLKMNIIGTQVIGEYFNLPAEKDSKVGEFSGTVGPMDPKISGRIADVWWDSYGEGMNVKEQLKIEFGEGSAVALYGEMIDKGDGVYVYKDTTKLTPGFQMSQTDCEALDDKIIVEKYIRENIKTIAPQAPVLGGAWYVILVNINPSMKNGTVTYEDGHIQGKASFVYTRNGGEVSVSSVQSIK